MRRKELFTNSNVFEETISYRMKTQLCICSVSEVHCMFTFSGYYAEQNAIIVFAACFLPDSNCDNYNYVMEQLFL